MPRFHLPPDSWQQATLDPAESHHCLDVLRLRQGDRLTVFDGKGREADATIASVQNKKVTLQLGRAETTPPPPCAITLAQAIPKGKNMDLIVQKAVELGATAIAPLLSERTVVQLDAADLAKKRDKWRATALEACKQSGQNHLPEVSLPTSPRDFLAKSDPAALHLIASLQPGALPVKHVLANHTAHHGTLPTRVVMLIGPEGDFTPAESSHAISRGCHPVTLGPIILRTETAAIYCLSVLAHELFIPAAPPPAEA
jgi:16S rRNA (uracil1498-N3)-methyltransferase